MAKIANIAIKEGSAWDVFIDKSIFLNTKTKRRTIIWLIILNIRFII